MNRLSDRRSGWKMWGVEYQYRSDCVIWYTNRMLACGPRVAEISRMTGRERFNRKRADPRNRLKSRRLMYWRANQNGLPF